MQKKNIKRSLHVVLGFDFGMKRIGVAVGQTITQTASPLKTLAAIDGVPNWQTIADLVNQWQPHAFIVGLPLNMDDSPQAMTEHAKQFGTQLSQHFDLPVHYIDERLTSVDARTQLYEKGGYRKLAQSEIDSVAAQLIVETWMAS